MAQYLFGAGNMYVTQLVDASGNAIANPTPFRLMTLQEVSIDLSADVKLLHGQNQFAEAVGRGKMAMTVKAKPGRISAGVWNAVFFGQTLSSGLLTNFTDSTGTAVPTTPFQVTVTPPSSGTFVADLGVINSVTGLPLTRVASGPTTGQYSVNTGTGVYTFASADVAIVMYINYQYSTSTAATGSKQVVSNLAMGLAPYFKADITVNYAGKLTNLQFPRCVATKLGIGLKNEDFTVPELEFSAMDDGTGVPMKWSTSE